MKKFISIILSICLISSILSVLTVGFAAANNVSASTIVNNAKSMIDKYPYVWGGESPEEGGFDCSGFVWYVYNKMSGVNISLSQAGRSKAALASAGTKINGISNFLPGDIVQFDYPHVAIYIGDNTIVEAQKSGTRIKYRTINSNSQVAYAIRVSTITQGSSPSQNQVIDMGGNSASSSNITNNSQTTSSVKISPNSYPSGNLKYGNDFTLTAKFTSDCAIVEARAYMLDSNKNVIMEAKGSSTTGNYYVEGYALDKGMKFNELSPGGYYLKYYVKDANGDTNTWTSDKFYIVKEEEKKPVVDMSTIDTGTQSIPKEPKSTLSINLTNCPSSIENGEAVLLMGTIASNYLIKEAKVVIFAPNGIGLYPTTIYPNSKSVRIENTDLSDGICFQGLPGGTYRIEISAKDEKTTKEITKNIKISERIVEEDDDSWLYTIDTPEKFEDLGYNPIVSGDEEYFEEDEVNDGEIVVKVNGKKVNFDQPPIIQDGRTLVPVRAACEAMGINVQWIEKEQRVILTKHGEEFDMQIGNKKYWMNQVSYYYFDVPPQIINGRTLLPIRAIAQFFGYDVEWNGNTQTVIIESE